MNGVRFEKMKTKIAYIHDGNNSYDRLFLDYFKKRYDVCLITLEQSPKEVPKGVKAIRFFDIASTLLRSTVDESQSTTSLGWRGASVRVFLSQLQTPLRAFFLRRCISSIRPQIIIGGWATTYGLYAALTGFNPFILFVWGSDIMIMPKKHRFLKLPVKYALSRASAVLVDSEIQKKEAMQLGVPEERILMFPWFDSKLYKNWGSQGVKYRRIIRDKLGWEDKVIVISSRKHYPIYNIECLINAIPLVTKEEDQVRFLILGHGDLSQKLKKQVEASGVAEYVLFVGEVPRNQVSKYLNAADIYVSTSLSDGTSASLLEAMVCSLPSVVTSIPGNLEWVKDHYNGLTFHPGNSEELASKIILLSRDENLREKLGKRGNELVTKKVDWERNMRLLDDCIARLTQKQS